MNQFLLLLFLLQLVTTTLSHHACERAQRSPRVHFASRLSRTRRGVSLDCVIFSSGSSFPLGREKERKRTKRGEEEISGEGRRRGRERRRREPKRREESSLNPKSNLFISSSSCALRAWISSRRAFLSSRSFWSAPTSVCQLTGRVRRVRLCVRPF